MDRDFFLNATYEQINAAQVAMATVLGIINRRAFERSVFDAIVSDMMMASECMEDSLAILERGGDVESAEVLAWNAKDKAESAVAKAWHYGRAPGKLVG